MTQHGVNKHGGSKHAANQHRRPAEAPVTRLSPFTDFLAKESSSAVLLIVAAIAAMVWVNSPWGSSYHEFWDTRFTIDAAGHVLSMTLEQIVSDGLMALFFVVVGLEIKRELVDGELRDPRRAALPVIAAIGGMVVPALIFLALNTSGPGRDGWGIPMATDIAVALGVLALLGPRISASMKVFLLALAIVDDIGAITVIAVFYSDDVRLEMLAAALGIVAVVVMLRWLAVRSTLVFVALGLGLWLAVHEAGIHATIAGVVMGLLCPVRPYDGRDYVDAEQLALDELALDDLSPVDAAGRTIAEARASVSVLEWLEHQLHPWTSFVILPLFALANAGIEVSGSSLGDAARSSVTFGVVLGLVAGKTLGITAAVWIAERLKIADRPQELTMRRVLGLGAVAGVGFTVSILVTSLAFADPVLRDEALIGVLVGSIVSAALGAWLLIGASEVDTAGPGVAGPGVAGLDAAEPEAAARM